MRKRVREELQKLIKESKYFSKLKEETESKVEEALKKFNESRGSITPKTLAEEFDLDENDIWNAINSQNQGLLDQ